MLGALLHSHPGRANQVEHKDLLSSWLRGPPVNTRLGATSAHLGRGHQAHSGVRADIVNAIENGQSITIDLPHSDQIGLQRTISRFGLVPAGDTWIARFTQHWYLDWEGPRPEDLALTATVAILRDQEAAVQRRASAEDTDRDADAGGSAEAEGGHTDAQ